MFESALVDLQDDPNTVLPEGMSQGEAERELRQAQFDLSTHEGVMGNMVHMIDLIGIGAL